VIGHAIGRVLPPTIARVCDGPGERKSVTDGVYHGPGRTAAQHHVVASNCVVKEVVV